MLDRDLSSAHSYFLTQENYFLLTVEETLPAFLNPRSPSYHQVSEGIDPVPSRAAP